MLQKDISINKLQNSFHNDQNILSILWMKNVYNNDYIHKKRSTKIEQTLLKGYIHEVHLTS